VREAHDRRVDNEPGRVFGSSSAGREVRGALAWLLPFEDCSKPRPRVQRELMKSKGKKKEELKNLKADLTDAKNLFVAQFQGMTVAQDTDLRQKIRDSKSKYRVVKNTLARKAAEGTAVEGVAKSCDGSIAIEYNAKSPCSLAKAL